MGCALSHQLQSPALTLCCDRTKLMAEAIRLRYVLADAHCAYADSLQATGATLHDFLHAVQDVAREEEGTYNSTEQIAKQVDDEDSDGGHIQFPLDEKDQEDASGGDDDNVQVLFPSDEEIMGTLSPLEPLQPPTPAPSSLLEMASPSPPPQMAAPFPTQQMAAPYGRYGYAPTYSYGVGSSSVYGGGYYAEMGGYGYNSFTSTVYHTRSQTSPPSVSYEHRLQDTSTTIQHYHYQGDGAIGPAAPLSYYYSRYSYPYQCGPQGESISLMAPPSYSQSAAPLPPPSPPLVLTTWDFLSLFETSESYYYPDHPAAVENYMPRPSWTSSEPLDDEDIPELEDDDIPELEDKDIPELEDEEELGEVVGEVNGGVECTAVNNGEVNKEEERKSSASEVEELCKKSRMSDIGSSVLSKEEFKSQDSAGSILDESSMVHVVDEAVVEEQLNDSAIAGLPVEPMKMYQGDVELIQEIKVQFDRASKSAREVCKILEVGKMPYNKNNSGLKVSSMMICGFPSMGKKLLHFEEEKAMECGNLSSTLQKLYMWEKKLLNEVKIVEKIRLLYNKKCEELKLLYHTGAEAHKLEKVEIYIRKLSTKISVGLKVAHSISDKINNLRDQTLWPQTHELMQRFMQMWQTMSQCHKIQCHAMSQVEDIDSIIATARFSEAHIELARQLELQLLDMTASFAAWFVAQKSYASTLNEWLKKGVEYVPEVTDDGVPPYSPGRLGAPPVFTIYNNWATSMVRISEMEVVGPMQAFASNVLGLWEKHKAERKQGMFAGEGMGKELRLMARDELAMRKALEAKHKKLLLVSKQSRQISLPTPVLPDGVPPAEAGLQSCMYRSFEAMESLATACTNALKNLHLRSQEDTAQLAQEEDGTVA